MAGIVIEPTETQIKFVRDICDSFGVEEPEKFTKECYSNFISEYKRHLYSKGIQYSDHIFWR